MAKHVADNYLAGIRRAGEWVLLVVVVGAALAAVAVPRLAGATPYAVLTGSMQPTMPAGTLVVVRDVDAADIRTGDVITFNPRPNDPAVVTHRVVGVGFDGDGRPAFRTRGDANDAADPWTVREQQVVGERWYFVPFLGYVTDALTGRQRAAATLVVAGGLLLYALWMFAGALRDRAMGERVRRPEGRHA
jgi:signal peptidase